MKNKKRKPQLMKYEQRVQIEVEYGVGAVCGYARAFHKAGEYMTARCSLTDARCKRELPMDMKQCDVYMKWLQDRQDIMKAEGRELGKS